MGTWATRVPVRLPVGGGPCEVYTYLSQPTPLWTMFEDYGELSATHPHTSTKFLLKWLPGGEEPTCQSRKGKRRGFDPWVGKIPWRRAWQPTAVFLPGEFHGQKSLEGYSPWGRRESDTADVT